MQCIFFFTQFPLKLKRKKNAVSYYLFRFFVHDKRKQREKNKIKHKEMEHL